MSTNEQQGTRLLGPFNRVEGDLEIRVEAEGNRIAKAWVNSPLFRGYEQILLGKDPRDALVYTPRICGICSVAQSVAAAQAIADAQELEATLNGQLANNIILCAENLADHLTHFYLFFMPDFARECYQEQSWFADTLHRFKAQTGAAAQEVLPARAEFLHITGLLAGKWPHTMSIQPGGSTRPLKSQERMRLLMIIRSFRLFLEKTLFHAKLEEFSDLKTAAAMWDFVDAHPRADISAFLNISRSLQLDKLGRAYDKFMSYGAYRIEQQHLFTRGVWQQKFQHLNAELIREDVSYSWVNADAEAKHPFEGSTVPDTDEGSAYSWCKAPRLNDEAMEVGAIARQVVDGHPLILDLLQQSGANVQNRVVARLLELAILVPKMEEWAERLSSNEPYCISKSIPADAEGVGLIEAARGSLGHWLRIQNGHILNYQIIAPTTWNFSPRDQREQAGALEMALQDTLIENEALVDVSIQHIIRSFDPCMVCTVH